LGFCVCKFFDFVLINLLSDSWARARARLVLQSFDFLWILSVMWVCRPRKEWPPYFTLSINELPGQEEGGDRAANLPMSMTSLITQQFLFDRDDDDKKSVGSVGSDEMVMFVNPNNYTLDLDDCDPSHEISAFDPDIIEEETAINNAKPRREELERMLREGRHQLDEAHIKAELVLGMRDKKQVKKLRKQKLIQSQSSKRNSLYNRLFKRNDVSVTVSQELNSSSSESDSDPEVQQPPLNSSNEV